MSPDHSESRDPDTETHIRNVDGNGGKDKDSRDADKRSTGAGDPEEMATIEHHSDSLIGETLTISGGDAKVIGNFRLTRRLGAGGFGIVYAAEDLRLDRTVALKVPFAVKGEGAGEYYKRVVREGRAAAALDHPNIVSIYEVGERNGQPFIVSQLIEGPALYDRNTSGRMEQHEAAKLMVLIARALAYAHRKGIVHRDMKPGNVLLDVSGVPYVNDFGIAKYESTDETISSENSIIGTPAYMSPEQAAGQSGKADRRSDLYSLGVMIYELVTGERPFRGSSRMLLHQVIHADPQPPRQLVHAIHRDLETICMKCLEKDPNRRYQTCDELADELERFLAGEAIEARPVSRVEHAWRRCRRYPVASSLAVAFVVSLIAGLAGVTWQWRRAEANRAQEQEARREVEHSRQALAEEVDYSNRLLYGARMGLAADSLTGGDYLQAKNHLNLSSGLAKFADIDHRILRNRAYRYKNLHQHVEQVTDVAISDDESMIAACGLRTLLVWDVESGHVIYRAREKGKQLRCVAFAPKSDLIAWSGQSGRIAFRSVRNSSKTYPTLEHGDGVRRVAFTEDGSSMMSAGDDGKIIIWSMKTMQVIQTINAHKGAALDAKFVDDASVISGGADGRICLSSVDSGETTVIRKDSRPVMAVTASSDRKQFAAGFENGRLLVGEIDAADKAQYYGLPDTYAVDLQFLDEASMLATSLLSGTIIVSNFPDLHAARTYKCVKGFGKFAIGRQSGQLVVGAGDGSIEAVDLKDAVLDEISFPCRSLSDAKIIDQARALVVCADTGPASVIHLASGRRLRQIPDFSDSSSPQTLRNCKLLCVEESADRKRLAFGTDTGQILIWNVADAKLRVHGTDGGRGIPIVRFCGDATKLVSAGEDGAVRVWDLNRANDSTEVARHGAVIRGLEISPDGNLLIAVAADGSATLLDANSFEEKTRLETGRAFYCVGWSHDSSQLAIGDSKGGVLLYASDLANEPTLLRGHAGPVNCVLFSPSGETLISGGNDDDLAFWDLQTGQTKMVESSHDRNIRSISLSRDGNMLLTADVGGLIRLWPTNSEPLTADDGQ